MALRVALRVAATVAVGTVVEMKVAALQVAMMMVKKGVWMVVVVMVVMVVAKAVLGMLGMLPTCRRCHKCSRWQLKWPRHTHGWYAAAHGLTGIRPEQCMRGSAFLWLVSVSG